MRAIRRVWGWLRLDWQRGLRHLPFFTQRTAVLLLGVLVATLALLGGVVALVGWPGANGPTRLVPGGQAAPPPTTHPRPGAATSRSEPGPGDRPGAGAATTTPAPGTAAGPGRPVQAPAGRGTVPAAGPGPAATGAQGSGGAAGAGAGGPRAAPPTTSTTLSPGTPLDPVEELLGPVVSAILP